jgi:hypothetical protein
LFPARASESGRISAWDSAGCRAPNFFTARAILQRLLERVFNHYARNIGGFFMRTELIQRLLEML